MTAVNPVTASRADISAALKRYLDFWASITVEDVPAIKALVTDDFHFVDPFNELRSSADMVTLLDHMFQICDQPRFAMRHYGLSDQSPNADGVWHGYALWDFSFAPKRGGNLIEIDGMTAITITAEGKISAHIDHWDTGQQVLRHIPVLGRLVTLIFNKMAADKRFRRA